MRQAGRLIALVHYLVEEHGISEMTAPNLEPSSLASPIDRDIVSTTGPLCVMQVMHFADHDAFQAVIVGITLDAEDDDDTILNKNLSVLCQRE